jgi:hypothetical protein
MTGMNTKTFTQNNEQKKTTQSLSPPEKENTDTLSSGTKQTTALGQMSTACTWK